MPVGGVGLSGVEVDGLERPDEAARIDAAVDAVLDRGLRTPDLAGEGETAVGTDEVTEAVLAELSA